MVLQGTPALCSPSSSCLHLPSLWQLFAAPTLASASPGRGRRHPQLVNCSHPAVDIQLWVFGMPSSTCPRHQNCHSSLLASWVCMKCSPIAVKWELCSELVAVGGTLTPQLLFPVKLNVLNLVTLSQAAPAEPQSPRRGCTLSVPGETSHHSHVRQPLPPFLLPQQSKPAPLCSCPSRRTARPTSRAGSSSWSGAAHGAGVFPAGAARAGESVWEIRIVCVLLNHGIVGRFGLEGT